MTQTTPGEPLADAVEWLLAGPQPLPIVEAGDPVLRRPATSYQGELPAQLLTALLGAMRETMVRAPGVGLAAPQVGLGVSIAVVEDPAPVSAEVALARARRPVPFRVLINPTYTADGTGLAAFYEGCLSVAGFQAVVARPDRVRLRGQDGTGAELDEIVQGWAARIVQHETDHLHGTLYLDKAELRSLSSNSQFLRRWAQPHPDVAGRQLGFDPAPPVG